MQVAFATVDTAPDIISATPVAGGDVDLVWTEISLSGGETFTNYKLYRHTSGTFTPPGTGTEITECTGMTTVTTTICTDTFLTTTTMSDATEYFYEIVYTTSLQTDTATGVEVSATTDATAPTAITDTNLVSDSTDTSRADEGAVLTLTFTTNEAAATPTVTIAGETASVSGGPTSWSATYTTAEAHSGVTDAGNAAISITYEDLAGNAGASSPDTTIDSGGITFDFTAPTAITNLALVSDNADTSLALEGDVLTLTFTTNEAIATPTITIAGEAPDVGPTDLGSGTSWSATYTTAEADSGVTDGQTAAVSVTFADTAGNTGTGSPDTTLDSGGITFDFTAPTPTISSTDGANDSTINADPINFSISFDESVNEFASDDVTISGTATPGVVTGFSGTGAGPYTFTIVPGNDGTVIIDVAGSVTTDATGNNNAAAAQFTINSDKSIVTSVTSYTASTVNNGDQQTITILFDQAVTGTPTIALSGAKTLSATPMSDSGNQITWTYDAGTVHTGDGTVTITLGGTVTDTAGNVIATTPSSNTFTIDNTLVGATSYTATTVNNGDQQTITVNFSEVVTGTPTIALSGAKTVSATAMTDSGDATTWTYDTGTAHTGDGTVTITLGGAVTDAVGNSMSTTPTSNTFTIDNTGPTSTATYSATTVNDGDQQTITVTFGEAVTGTPTIALSGQETVSATAMSGGPTVWTYDDGTTHTGDGTVTITLGGATDAVGNAIDTAPTDNTFTIDNTAITSTATYSATTVNDGDQQTITVTFGEAVTGTPTIALSGTETVSATAMSGGPTVWTYDDGTTHTGDGTVTITLGGATDAGGNPISTTPTSNTFTIDNTAPDFVSTFLSGSKSLTVIYDEPVTTVAGHYTLISVDGGATETATSVDTSTSNSILIKWTSASAVATDGITFTIGSVTDLAGNALSNGGAKTIQAQAAEAVATTTLTDNDGDGDVEITISADTLINTIVAPANTTPVVSVADFIVAPAGDIEDARAALGGSASTAAFPAQTITVQSDTATIQFPPSLQVLFPDGDETIKIAVSTKKPTNDSDFVAAFPNVDLTTANVVEFGNPDTNLTFSAPVKITITGLSGTVFTIDKDGDTKEILSCDGTVVDSTTANTFIGTITGNATTDGNACYAGNDIWTKHFSGFGSSSTASSGGGGGGGDSTSPDLSTNSFSSANMGFGGMLSLDPNAVASENLFFVGEKIDFVFEFYENSGTGVEHIELVTGISDHQTIYDSELWIEYDRGEEPIIHDSEGYWSDAGVTITGTGDKPRVLFSAVFDKPMGTSDIIVRVWDEKRNSVDIEFENVIKVINSPTTSVLDEPEIDSEPIVTETISEITEPLPEVESSTMVWAMDLENDEVGVYTKANFDDLEDKIRVLRALANNAEIQNELIQSNAEFESLDDPYSVIDTLEAEWMHNPKIVTEHMQSLMNNESALISKAIVEHHQEDLVPLISIAIANTYGVNTAITEKTQDYIQSDESWWKKTKESGIYIMSGSTSEGYTGLYTLEISKIINDREGNFIGIIKATVNFEKVFLSE